MITPKSIEEYLIKLHSDPNICKNGFHIPLSSEYFENLLTIPRLRNESTMYPNHHKAFHDFNGPDEPFVGLPRPHISEENKKKTLGIWFDPNVKFENNPNLNGRYIKNLKGTKLAMALSSGKQGEKLLAMIDGMFDHLFGYKEMKASSVEAVALEYDYLVLNVFGLIARIIWIYFQDEGKVNLAEQDTIRAIEKRIKLVDQVLALAEAPVYMDYRVEYPADLPSVLGSYRANLIRSKDIFTYEASRIGGKYDALKPLVLRAAYALLHGHLTEDGVDRGVNFASLIVDRMGLDSVGKERMKQWVLSHIETKTPNNDGFMGAVDTYRFVETIIGYDPKNMGLVKVEKKKPEGDEIIW